MSLCQTLNLRRWRLHSFRVEPRLVESFACGFKGALQIATFVVAIAALSIGQQTAGHDLPRELLYIVDSDHGNSDSHERLFSVDPQRKVIVKNYPTGSRPDIALSPDGTRLYVAY